MKVDSIQKRTAGENMSQVILSWLTDFYDPKDTKKIKVRNILSDEGIIYALDLSETFGDFYEFIFMNSYDLTREEAKDIWNEHWSDL